jgi:hypothetical protein
MAAQRKFNERTQRFYCDRLLRLKLEDDDSPQRFKERLAMKTIGIEDRAKMIRVEKIIKRDMEYFKKTLRKIDSLALIQPPEVQTKQELHTDSASKRKSLLESDPKYFNRLALDDQKKAINTLMIENHKEGKSRDVVEKVKKLGSMTNLLPICTELNIMSRASGVLLSSEKSLNITSHKEQIPAPTSFQNLPVVEFSTTEQSEPLQSRIHFSRKASPKVDSFRITSPSFRLSNGRLPSTPTLAGTFYNTPTEPTEDPLRKSSVRNLASSRDLYFKHWVSRAPEEIKEQMVDIQQKVQLFHRTQRKEDKGLLSQALSVGKGIQRMQNLSNVDMEQRIVLREFQKLEKALEGTKRNPKSLLKMKKKRRKSINSKLLEVIV